MSRRTIESRFEAGKKYPFDNKEMTFREIFERGKAKGRMTLRRKQMTLAEAGNCTMLIWLGKNILGQRDTWTVAREPDQMRSCYDCKVILNTNGLQLMQVWDHETRTYEEHYICQSCIKNRQSIPGANSTSKYAPWRNRQLTQ